MYIKRDIFGETVKIKLTEDEVRSAYYEYLYQLDVIDVEQFILQELEMSLNELESKGITKDSYIAIAHHYEDMKNKGYSDKYSMASSVVKLLKDKGIVSSEDASKYIDKYFNE